MTTVKRPEIERALKARGENVRFFLLYGPDDAGSRGLVRKLAAAMGNEAERVDLTGSELKADPARLADEAASISLFGGARYIVVEPCGDEALAAVEALLEAPAATNPVVLVAGALKGSSKLLKLAAADKAVLACASYAPEGAEADRMVTELAQGFGLIARGDVARRIADGAAGNRAIVEQELRKLALFIDASPESPKALEHEAVDGVGAASEEGDLSRLVESVASGDAPALEAELLRLSSVGIEGIPLLRAMLRRMHLLARLRSEVDRGSSPSSVIASSGKVIFWKEKKGIERQLSRWRSDLIAKSVERLMAAEREVKASGGLGPIAADEELFAICRQAARLR